MTRVILGIAVYGRWKLGIGDPTVTGWLTTAVFIATALLCCVYARCPEPLKGHRVFWWSLGVGLLVLGINKQLDLHVLLEAVGKEVARRTGWYSYRRIIQMWFMVGLATVSSAFIAFIAWAVHGVWRQRWLAFCGIVLLVAFIVVRAGSIHHVCEMLKLQPPGFWSLSALQGGGIACIAVSAVLGIANCRQQVKYHRLVSPPRN